ncbi:hypothetical protein GCM10011505_10830 [Tistrella bauzanensis]|uniref:Uncharacterized protein n=1 Tax=Tistrella bauzanensis TaxID=657419 RepID=A0ABQ1IA06_9PROT|nr:hypothetical protein GCM10011505_10830 [Tistrella bauzanensis]
MLHDRKAGYLEAGRKVAGATRLRVKKFDDAPAAGVRERFPDEIVVHELDRGSETLWEQVSIRGQSYDHLR